MTVSALSSSSWVRTVPSSAIAVTLVPCLMSAPRSAASRCIARTARPASITPPSGWYMMWSSSPNANPGQRSRACAGLSSSTGTCCSVSRSYMMRGRGPGPKSIAPVTRMSSSPASSSSSCHSALASPVSWTYSGSGYARRKIRALPCELPFTWPGSNASSRTTCFPRRLSAHAAADPASPPPTTTTPAPIPPRYPGLPRHPPAWRWRQRHRSTALPGRLSGPAGAIGMLRETPPGGVAAEQGQDLVLRGSGGGEGESGGEGGARLQAVFPDRYGPGEDQGGVEHIGLEVVAETEGPRQVPAVCHVVDEGESDRLPGGEGPGEADLRQVEPPVSDATGCERLDPLVSGGGIRRHEGLGRPERP